MGFLDPPGSSPLSTVAVGNHVVWAVTRDKCVWFRNGIHGGGSGESEALARGVKWVGMVCFRFFENSCFVKQCFKKIFFMPSKLIEIFMFSEAT